MTWLVVKFNVEDTVEAVPNTWYIKKNFQYYWPPKGTVKNVIIDFIKKKHTPEANWILYEATLLGVYGKVYIFKHISNICISLLYITLYVTVII